MIAFRNRTGATGARRAGGGGCRALRLRAGWSRSLRHLRRGRDQNLEERLKARRATDVMTLRCCLNTPRRRATLAHRWSGSNPARWPPRSGRRRGGIVTNCSKVVTTGISGSGRDRWATFAMGTGATHNRAPKGTCPFGALLCALTRPGQWAFPRRWRSGQPRFSSLQSECRLLGSFRMLCVVGRQSYPKSLSPAHLSSAPIGPAGCGVPPETPPTSFPPKRCRPLRAPGGANLHRIAAADAVPPSGNVTFDTVNDFSRSSPPAAAG